MNATAAKVVSHEQPDPLETALHKLSHPTSKNCHMLPAEARALDSYIKLLEAKATRLDELCLLGRG